MAGTEKRRNHSKKRDAILNALVSTDTHPSAEQLYNSLKDEIPDLSLGTVYRNLAVFCEEGLARSIGVVNGQERFDGNTTPHAHFACLGCGSVIDLEPDSDPKAISRVEKQHGCRVSLRRTEYRGLCADCIKAEAES